MRSVVEVQKGLQEGLYPLKLIHQNLPRMALPLNSGNPADTTKQMGIPRDTGYKTN